jgi:hypothetical protein
LKTAKSHISPFERREKKDRRGVKNKNRHKQTNTHTYRVVSLKEKKRKKESPFFSIP